VVRLQTYRTSIATSWILTALVLLQWIRLDRPWSDLRLGIPLHLGFWTSFAAAGAAAAFLAWQRASLSEQKHLSAEIMDQLGGLLPMLPHTDREFRWFSAVSLTAGICEEVLYRGFILVYVAAQIPLAAAVVVSSVLFGLAHAYQGPRGILQTGAVGLVLGSLAVYSGSLWIPMALHAFIDWNSGRLAYDLLRGGGSDETVSPEPPQDTDPLP
jgi:membrane protease YdiL (CAAX protease family)